jgi:hypothetical protein
MTMITGEVASETNATCATLPSGTGNATRQKTGKLLRSWKAATKAATARPAPAPSKRRRRRGDSRAQFHKAARNALRARPMAQNYAAALTALDWLNLWHGNEAACELDGEYNHTANPFVAPHL